MMKNKWDYTETKIVEVPAFQITTDEIFEYVAAWHGHVISTPNCERGEYGILIHGEPFYEDDIENCLVYMGDWIIDFGERVISMSDEEFKEFVLRGRIPRPPIEFKTKAEYQDAIKTIDANWDWCESENPDERKIFYELYDSVQWYALHVLKDGERIDDED